jgi:hypothetical protein
MKRLLLASAFISLSFPAMANDGQAIGQIIDMIAQMAQRHHQYREPEYLGNPDGPPEQPGANVNAGPEIIKWLDRQGIHDAFITGRRDLDCRMGPDFLGGWGVVIKDRKNRPVSGVVCIDGNHIGMQLDR